MKIGVYIGSFDPIHNGHIKIIKTIINKKLVDKILIIPSNDYWDKKINLSLEKRVKLIEDSIKDKLNKEYYYVDDELGKYDYTYQLFRALKKQYKNDELYLILGADNILKFEQWKNYKELLKYGFIVIRRNDTDIEKSLIALEPKTFIILDIKGINHISSSYIRENIDDYAKVRGMINKKEYKFVLNELTDNK